MAATTRIDELTVSELREATRGAWDAYVREADGGLPLHLSGWQQVMDATYGYESCYLLAQRQNEIVGVLPLLLVPSVLTGRRAMTLPGGLCAEDAESAAALLARGYEAVRKAGLGRVQIQDSRQDWPGQWQSSSDHVYWLLQLEESPEAHWRALDGNIRRQVRKARKNDLVAEIDRTGRLLDPFYEVFSRFTHEAGTPVFARSFLANLIDTFSDGFNIVVIWHKKEPVAGYFQLEMGATMYGMWGAALPETLVLRPAYLAIWELIADAIEEGFRYLDMGRSPAGSNASHFKGQWGGEAQPIYQLTLTEKDASAPANITERVQADGKLQLFMRLWPKLPLAFTRRMGPRLRWHVPFA